MRCFRQRLPNQQHEASALFGVLLETLPACVCTVEDPGRPSSAPQSVQLRSQAELQYVIDQTCLREVAWQAEIGQHLARHSLQFGGIHVQAKARHGQSHQNDVPRDDQSIAGSHYTHSPGMFWR